VGDRLNRVVYLSLDEVEGVRPKTDFAIGSLDEIKEASKSYEPAVSPFVMMHLRDKEKNYRAIAKVSIPESHKDISSTLLDYIIEVKGELNKYMSNRNPDYEAKGSITVHGTDDNAVLEMVKNYARPEELIDYEI